MNQRTIILLLIIVQIISTVTIFGQRDNTNNNLRIGVNVGISTQSVFPYNNPRYLYNNKFVKVELNIPIWSNSTFSFEAIMEPSIYFSQHQLLDETFIDSEWGLDYEEFKNDCMCLKSFREYAFNVGLVFGIDVPKNFGFYALASTGPIINETGTERLAIGMSFCNVLGVGINYSYKRFKFDLRVSLRHVSCAGVRKPNAGYNTAGIESGFSFQL